MKEAADILETAARIVAGDRRATHGDARATFKRIAAFWSAYLCVELTSRDVAMMNVLQKMARAQCGQENVDDFVDMAGYAALSGALDCSACKED